MKDLRMKFEASGTKSSPNHGSISEIDLLTDSKRSIRARQRIITTLNISSWVNKSVKPSTQKYNKAIIYLRYVFSN